jgi:hypothetical protein
MIAIVEYTQPGGVRYLTKVVRFWFDPLDRKVITLYALYYFLPNILCICGPSLHDWATTFCPRAAAATRLHFWVVQVHDSIYHDLTAAGVLVEKAATRILCIKGG